MRGYWPTHILCEGQKQLLFVSALHIIHYLLVSATCSLLAAAAAATTTVHPFTRLYHPFLPSIGSAERADVPAYCSST